MLISSAEVTCPHCWQTISLAIDLSVPEQRYVEDCEVCCRPMEVHYVASDGELVELHVEAAG